MTSNIVVNLFGGPGAGKSTVAAELFAALKKKRVSCELVTEYAKVKVWENATDVIRDQTYVFAKQNHMMEMVRGKVDVVVTDSPLLLSTVYMPYTHGAPKELNDLIYATHMTYNNINVFVSRPTHYDETGRLQCVGDAGLIDEHIIKLLDEKKIYYHSYTTMDTIDKLVRIVTNRYKY